MSMNPRDGKPGRWPDFFVIGASKAGTTSLDFYLGLHPEIHMARPKEPGFFADVPPPVGRWSLGAEWYRGLFKDSKGLRGDCSTAYAMSPSIPGVARRVASFAPEAKLVYLVRQPYERLQSHYLMDFRTGVFAGSFEEFATTPSASFDASCYGRQFSEYLEFFPSERILVVETAELEKNTPLTMARIFRHIGAAETFRSPLFRARLHVGSKARFPNKTGRRILETPVIEMAKSALPRGMFHHFRNLVLLPFEAPTPAIEIAPRVEERVRSILRDEVALLRDLSGSALPSLEVA